MQVELAAEAAAARRLAIHIAGINAIGSERDNAVITQGRTLPWLQDAAPDLVWDTWRVGNLRPEMPFVLWRDVVVLDAENRAIAVFNLTDHDLASPAEYRALEDLLRRAASQ